jgi:pyruvate/2-oxoglutarate dehydrogenase complex dihydrolipoamide dehydrogenase (E3) component
LKGGGTQQISAPVVVIDAGARPGPLAIAGAGYVPALDSTSIMELEEITEHLIILGGGFIGLEFGQMFRRFGNEVAIIEGSARLMMMEDEDVSDEVVAIFRDEGITISPLSTPVRVEPADARLRPTYRTEDGEQQLQGSHLLSAIGRVPNTDELAPSRCSRHPFLPAPGSPPVVASGWAIGVPQHSRQSESLETQDGRSRGPMRPESHRTPDRSGRSVRNCHR